MSPFERQKPKGLAILAIVLLPILVFYAILFREMRSLPQFDDYQAILSFELGLRHLPTLGQKALYILTVQHDEYKLIFEHILIAIQSALIGHISFTFLVVLGNLFLLGILGIYWKQYFSEQQQPIRRLILFLPICYLLFELNYAETVDWAMCGLQTMPVLFFSLASIHLLTKFGEKAFLLACLCAWLGCLASSNAFLLAPVGLLMLLPRRSIKRIALWTLTIAGALAIYLFHYIRITRANYNPHMPASLKAVFFLSFLGSSVENMHHFPVRNGSVALGILIFLTFLYALFTRYDRQHPFAFYTALWMLISAALVAQVRSGLGMEMSLTNRYKIYSDLLLIFCYGFAVHRIDKRSIAPQRQRLLYIAALVPVILLCASSDLFGYKFLHRRRESVELGYRLYSSSPSSNSPMISINGDPITSGEPEFARITMNAAIAEGIYLPPAGP